MNSRSPVNADIKVWDIFWIWTHIHNSRDRQQIKMFSEEEKPTFFNFIWSFTISNKSAYSKRLTTSRETEVTLVASSPFEAEIIQKASLEQATLREETTKKTETILTIIIFRQRWRRWWIDSNPSTGVIGGYINQVTLQYILKQKS